ncbi:DUF5076 domain-containing protein [Bacillus sp. NP157]|nr:DUF5076 domain-containing protein [Bacillus sp. NP157]
MKQQPIPPAALDDEHSLEMMRVWIAKKGMHTSLNIGIYEGQPNLTEEKAWGMLFADAARHVAHALSERYGAPHGQVLAAIRAAMDAELDKPTTKLDGAFLRHN